MNEAKGVKNFCSNQTTALFVRHARLDKNGRKYGYGEWFCAFYILVHREKYEGFFSTSELDYLAGILGFPKWRKN